MGPIRQDRVSRALSTGRLSTETNSLLSGCVPVPRRCQVLALTDLIRCQDGVLSRAQVVGLPGRKRLEWLVRDGQWTVPVPGVVLTHNGPETLVQRRWIAVLGCGPNAVLAGLSAAVAGGLRRRVTDPIDVLVTGRGSERRCGRYPATVRVHRTTLLPDRDLLLARRPPRTSMPRSLVDAAQWARSDDEARAVVAAACHQGLARPLDVLATVERMPRCGSPETACCGSPRG